LLALHARSCRRHALPPQAMTSVEAVNPWTIARAAAATARSTAALRGRAALFALVAPLGCEFVDHRKHIDDRALLAPGRAAA
jgi:hypothetical protein